MSIEQPQGELSINRTNTDMIIKKESPKVIIDQYQCFAEAGLKNNEDMIKEYAQLGHKKAIEGIRRIVSEGNMLANVRSGSPNMVARIAKSISWGGIKEFKFDMIPKSRPKIEVEGYLQIDWNIGELDINYTPHSPKINYQIGKVEAYLNRKPSIDINYIDERL
ncbi:MAG: hypothetical protein FH761_03135 [Firmicutes bacterium]|nr:hypothetical protein [Bacillota bacterium]